MINIEKNKYRDLTYQDFNFIQDILSIINNARDTYNKEIRFKISAKVVKINHSPNNYYYGCAECKKKMLNDRCKKCGGEKKIIILHYSVNVVDCTSSLWLLFFGELAENFLGIKGEEYKNIIEKGISKDNEELTLLNNKIEENEFLFVGKSYFYSYYNYEGYRMHVKYYSRKTKRVYYSLVNYLKNILK